MESNKRKSDQTKEKLVKKKKELKIPKPRETTPITFSRVWSMPSPNTFSIKPIHDLLNRYIKEGMIIIDPFSRDSSFGTITNDINPKTSAQYHLDAIEFLDLMITKGIQSDVVLFDRNL